jgi:hypothetical protein
MTEMMKQKNFALVIGVALVLFAGSLASAAFTKQKTDPGQIDAPAGNIVLVDQLDDPSGNAFTDQAFEAPYAAYNGEMADDFVVTAASGWDITTIVTPGSNTVAGANPFSVNHSFYADAAGLPGAVLEDCAFPGNTNFVSPGNGDLTTVVACNAPSGNAWFSQSVRQDFNPFGQHYWATRIGANGTPSVFRNPGNGFLTGCVDWQPANAVCGQAGADTLFQLLGNERPADTGGVPAVGPFGVALMILALGGGSAYVLNRRRA